MGCFSLEEDKGLGTNNHSCIPPHSGHPRDVRAWGGRLATNPVLTASREFTITRGTVLIPANDASGREEHLLYNAST